MSDFQRTTLRYSTGAEPRYYRLQLRHVILHCFAVHGQDQSVVHPAAPYVGSCRWLTLAEHPKLVPMICAQQLGRPQPYLLL